MHNTPLIRPGGGFLSRDKHVRVASRFLGKHRRGGIAICPKCHEVYPLEGGTICLGCQGESSYVVRKQGEFIDSQGKSGRNSGTSLSPKP